MALYIDPPQWNRGVGSTLRALGEERLAANGVDVAVLWTAKHSDQSRRFYERRGWIASGDEQTQQLGPTAVALHEVEYRKALA